jgi:hypothetical protein
VRVAARTVLWAAGLAAPSCRRQAARHFRICDQVTFNSARQRPCLR